MLKNKYLYYVAVTLMVINVLGYVSLGSIECILVLGGASYLANHFTKNPTVDIFIGLFVSNILFGCGRIKEGFEGFEDKLKNLANDADAAKKKCVGPNCPKAKAAAHVGALADAASKAGKIVDQTK